SRIRSAGTELLDLDLDVGLAAQAVEPQPGLPVHLLAVQLVAELILDLLERLLLALLDVGDVEDVQPARPVDRPAGLALVHREDDHLPLGGDAAALDPAEVAAEVL